jgi:hypothetical protein
MHCLSSLYWITTPIPVSGPFVAHHEEVVCVYAANSICFSAKSSVGGPAESRLRRKTNTICHIHTCYLLKMRYKLARSM